MINKLQKTLFLDRDGVINIEKSYLYKIEDFEFIEGIFELCRYYQDLGYLIIVVTNQSGIARKYYSEDDFNKLTLWMIEKFSQNNIEISKVYYCPHYPDISGECSCRKPKSGMFLEAQKEFKIDMQNSIMIGDKERDIEAGLNAGIEKNYLFDESCSVEVSRASEIVNKFSEIYLTNQKEKNRC